MKKFIFVLSAFVFLFTFSIQAQNSLVPDNSKAAISWSKTTHNFGTISQGKPVSTTFEVKNNTNRPLIITNVKPSCGCTTPSYTKEPIRPGGTGLVKAQYNAAAMGKFNKSITITTNNPDNPRQVVYISGEVTK